MRNNPSLIRRLIAHVRARDRVTTVRSSTKNNDDDDDESNATIVGDDDMISGGSIAIHDGNRTRQLRDAICRFDATGEIGTLFDDDSVDSVKRKSNFIYP